MNSTNIFCCSAIHNSLIAAESLHWINTNIEDQETDHLSSLEEKNKGNYTKEQVAAPLYDKGIAG